SDKLWGKAREAFPRSIIVSMSPPGYPSAWLHPGRARFRFAWQNHCSSLRYLPINSTDEALNCQLLDDKTALRSSVDVGKELHSLKRTTSKSRFVKYRCELVN